MYVCTKYLRNNIEATKIGTNKNIEKLRIAHHSQFLMQILKKMGLMFKNELYKKKKTL